MSLRHILVILSVLAVGACAAPRPVAVAPPPVLDPDSACLKDLRDRHVAFEAQAPFPPGSCNVPNPVKVSGDSQLRLSQPGVMSCSMARSLERFETLVLEPAALKVFGQKVVRLVHMGTYNCRTRRTEATAASAAGQGESRGGRLSEHAKGQAIDVGGFVLADGTVISVKTDWRGAGKRSDFLQEVARASCEHFNVVLTPNHNRLHNDHLHLDIGPHRLCGY
ncbi:MAG: extensin family protein [Rhodospirillaceae bacterium]|nr:extensin family protein [Rhodospirillaceae bacterium]